MVRIYQFKGTNLDMRKSLIIHPLLFAIFPILSLFAHNIEHLLLNVILIPILVTTCFTLLFWSLSALVFKDKRKAGLLISFSVLLFFSYGHFFNLISDFRINGFVIGKHRFFLPFCGILFIVCTYYLMKIPRDLYNVTKCLNVVAAFLIVMSLVNIGVYEFKSRGRRQDGNKESKEIDRLDLSAETGSLPDIYYFVFDRYASSSTLEKHCHYDNSEFIDYLVDRGFYVASESLANYPETSLSLASSLNMEYLDHLVDMVGEESRDRTVIYEMLEDYKVWRLLKSKRYKYIHLGSWWEPTRINRHADMNFNYGIPLDEFSMKLIDTTMLYPIIFHKHTTHRNRELYRFDKLVEIPDIEGPKFVFAHFLIPHDPYIFGRNGESLSDKEVAERGEKENYLNQLTFTNKKIMRLLDEILSKSKVSPIIILQSDEGPRFKELVGVNRLSLSGETLRARLGILNAYHMPNHGEDVLYKSITPVNSFRVIFNYYFGANYELLDDKSYMTTPKYPYRFVDVTGRVK